jgi:hypothetical protein
VDDVYVVTNWPELLVEPDELVSVPQVSGLTERMIASFAVGLLAPRTVTVTVDVDVPSAVMDAGLADTVTPAPPKNPSSSTTTFAMAAFDGPLRILTVCDDPAVAYAAFSITLYVSPGV